MAARKFPRPIKRVVVKLGSSIIASYRMKPKTALLQSLISDLSALSKDGVEVVLVSSGAIVLGMGQLQLKARPAKVASLQALAAIGQTVLMRTYDDLFKRKGRTCAQVLLTWDDFSERVRFNNARNALRAMLAQGVIPVVNENDTISTDEIKFGDNDKLSALVASLVHADLLVLLSDVEGLYELKAGRKKVFSEIKHITADIEGLAGDTGKRHFSKGGMAAKLEAIRIATHAKVPCVIAHGHSKNILSRIIAGERVGTYFFEREDRLLSRKHWISFGAKPKGMVVVDSGARQALLKGGRSLLLPGVKKVEGHFQAKDVIVVCDPQQQEFARGISRYSSAELLKRMQTEDQQVLRGQRELIHCDELVLGQR